MRLVSPFDLAHCCARWAVGTREAYVPFPANAEGSAGTGCRRVSWRHLATTCDHLRSTL